MTDDRTPRRVDLVEIAATHLPDLPSDGAVVQMFAAVVEIAGTLTAAPFLTDSGVYALRVAGAVLGWGSCLSCERPSPDLDEVTVCPTCRSTATD